MKILHILNEFENIGNGIVNVCCDLACEQAKHGHNVLVVSSGGEYVDLLNTFGGEHILLNQDRRISNIPKMVSGFYKIVKKFQPDIVHAHMMTGTVLANLLRNFFPYKIVTSVHNEYQKSSILMKYAHATIGVSKAVSLAMIKRGSSAARVHTIINGTIGSPRRIPKENIKPYDLAGPSIITIGQLSRRKGSDVLYKAFIEVLKFHPEAHLYYVGNPDWVELVQEVEASPYSKNIHFVGLEKEPLKYLLSGNIFAFPSIREPLGLVLIEAREAGIPIIASNVDGIPEALDNGKVGLLITPGNVKELTEKLTYLIQNPGIAKTIGRNGTGNLDRFSTLNMTNEYMSIYKKILHV